MNSSLRVRIPIPLEVKPLLDKTRSRPLSLPVMFRRDGRGNLRLVSARWMTATVFLIEKNTAAEILIATNRELGRVREGGFSIVVSLSVFGGWPVVVVGLSPTITQLIESGGGEEDDGGPD